MQPNRSKNTRVRGQLSRAICRAGLGAVLSFAGCLASGLDTEQVDPGQTSSELGAGPGPGITPTGSTSSAVAGASAVILGGTAGGPAVAPTTAPCAADADCRVERDNCSECGCQALGTSQSTGACYGEKVTCVLDPCADSVARCIHGHCAAESNNIR